MLKIAVFIAKNIWLPQIRRHENIPGPYYIRSFTFIPIDTYV